MARVTIEDCIIKDIKNSFELVLVASERAKQLEAGRPSTINTASNEPSKEIKEKSSVIALREIAGQTIDIENLRLKTVMKYQTGQDQIPLDVIFEEESQIEDSPAVNFDPFTEAMQNEYKQDASEDSPDLEKDLVQKNMYFEDDAQAIDE